MAHGNGYRKEKTLCRNADSSLRQSASGWQRLVSGRLVFQTSPDNSILLRNGITYPSSSILATGTWYKIAVEKGGLYRLDYDFLRNLGMNPDNIDPARLKIYGHGAGTLPELAGATPYTDAQEIPIQVVTAGSGFRSGDYIIAWLPGPEKISYQASSQTLSHTLHPYSFKNTFSLLPMAPQANGSPHLPLPDKLKTLPSTPTRITSLSMKKRRTWVRPANFGLGTNSASSPHVITTSPCLGLYHPSPHMFPYLQ